jgi:hypothetical protein
MLIAGGVLQRAADDRVMLRVSLTDLKVRQRLVSTSKIRDMLFFLEWLILGG